LYFLRDEEERGKETHEIVLDNESSSLGRHDEFLDNFTSVDTLFGIEVCRRFIDEQNIGWNTEYETDGDSLQLSSGQSRDELAIVAQRSMSLRLDILVNDWLDLHWLDDVGVELGV
jgi:hypothetical protein